ncbi:hypothetical protein PV328_009676 [Microctonus aethiopoides]|uniref:Sulfatase N-terminal domain-containing protein n=1 Tax=Microctonus aethiopoides TaxID=144406 RepID=A0AA39EZF7_9HYME|nr:hypothetical protein PV328_009676 [Microctonus aethiopoides]
MLARALLQLYLFNLFLFPVELKPNFLFIVVDDLRPALGCYKDPNAYTPNIDKLAKNSFLFNRAYAQQSLCAPSRNSFLTSRRPDTLLLYDFNNYWRDSKDKNFTTLPQYLKEKGGYVTKSIGKIFHPGISSNYSDDSPYSWSEIPFHPFTNKYKNAPVCFDDSSYLNNPASNLVCPVNVSTTPGGILPDMEILEAAKTFLNHQQSNENPFLLAVGFEKPHIPLKYPSHFKSYHPLDKFIDIKNYSWPKNINNIAYNPWIDLRKRHDIKLLNLNFPWEKISMNYAKKIIQSYYSAVSYIDYLIGILIKQLRILKLDTNTIIILTSDHGWSLGEHGLWAKYSNFDVALRVPLIISLPDDDKLLINNKNDNEYKFIKNNKITRINSIVELVDLFPTITEFAEIPIPICSIVDKSQIINNNNPCSEGISIVPVIAAAIANNSTNITWKKAAFSQYPRPSLEPMLKPNSDEPKLNEIKFMGYTVRTKRFRYTAWLKFNQNKKKSNWNKFIAEELYDHNFDPNEIFNQQNNDSYRKIKQKIKKLLKNGWRKALP